MQTASHAIVNLTLLDEWCPPDARMLVVVGGVLPDIPIYLFYLYTKCIRGVAEEKIWKRLYYRDQWYRIFSAFHSIPIMAALCLLGWGLGVQSLALLAGSALLHNVFDLPLHSEDAHRHFVPISNIRFESPLSYWDPDHHGRLVAGCEILFVAALSIHLYPAIVTWWAGVALVAINLVHVIGYVSFYLASGDTFQFDFVPED